MKKARKGRFLDETPIITSEEGIPAGYVRISSLVPADTPRAKTLLKVLSDAHKSGDLPAVKLVRRISEMKVGPVFVDPDKGKSILRQRMTEWASVVPAEPAPMQPEPEPEGRKHMGDVLMKSAADLMASVSLLHERLDRIESVTRRATETSENTAILLSTLKNEVADLKAAAELRLEAVES